jgi:hypothetical protein
MKKFPEPPSSVNALEDEVLAQWQAEDTFRQSRAEKKLGISGKREIEEIG